jgi:hypothetical protein
MIKIFFYIFFFIFITSCSNIEFVLEEGDSSNPFNNETSLIFNDTIKDSFNTELYSIIGNNEKDFVYLLKTSFYEKKENMIVKQNQVAQKIEYDIQVDYELYYLSMGCKIYTKKIITSFSFVPKSFGYNFGTDKSFEKLYKNSIRKNIFEFIRNAPKNSKKNCLN